MFVLYSVSHLPTLPAAAVIPAPIAYIKVVAVKKLVVEFRGHGWVGLPFRYVLDPRPLPSGELVVLFTEWAGDSGLLL